jgi:CRISPR-associated protein Csb2
MIGLSVTFDLGRYHATPWGAHVNEATIEWPPSPWRVLRAIHAAGLQSVDLTAKRSDLARALSRLATAPPPHFQLPPSNEAHTRHYVPLAGNSPSKPGETSLLIDAFRVLDPSSPLRVWWDVDLDAAERAALDGAVGAVGYLGRSESVCTACTFDRHPGGEPDAVPASSAGVGARWNDASRIDLLAVGEDTLDPLAVLGASVTDLRKRRTLLPVGATWIGYLVRRTESLPQREVSGLAERPTVALLRLVGGSRPGLTDALTVGHVLRAALQRRFDPEGEGARSAVFSGHDRDGPRQDQHVHSHYLAFPGSDLRRIDHLMVWAPEGFGRREVAALADLVRLRMREQPEPSRVALVALGQPDGLRFRRALGPAVRWHSMTPMALTRHPKRRGGVEVDGPVDQIRRELGLRGFPDPVEVELVQGPWMDFKRTRPGVPARDASPVVGARLRFAERVCGPIAIGRSSHFGLGLFEPED